MAQAQEAQEGKHVVAKPGARAKAEPKTENQARYFDAVRDSTITFATGPAGTGKTYIATSIGAVELMAGNFDRLIITRPAIEAGERIGFIPGNIDEKLSPYMAPITDNLNRCFGPAKVKVFKEKTIIEVIPVAFMRGRSLERCFIIVDEAQNTSISQMLMILTRLGAGSKMVVTGDPSQSDLPTRAPSGLDHAKTILRGIPGISWVELENKDIVRHPLVQAIVEAYERDRHVL